VETAFLGLEPRLSHRGPSALEAIAATQSNPKGPKAKAEVTRQKAEGKRKNFNFQHSSVSLSIKGFPAQFLYLKKSGL